MSKLNWQEKAYRLLYFTLAITLIGVLLWVCFTLKEILFVFIFALCINYLFAKPVEFLNKYINSRPVVIFIILALVATILGFLINSVYPVLQEQITSFKQALPNIKTKIEAMIYSVNSTVNIKIDLSQELQDLIESVDTKEVILGSFKRSIFIITAFVMTIVVSFYLLLDGNKAWQLFANLFPDSYGEDFKQIKKRIDSNLNSLVIGQFKVASLTSLVMLISYMAIGNKFAVLLGSLQMLEFIPIFGTWLAFIPAIIVVAATSGTTKALIVLIIYLVYSQVIRDHFIVPRIMGSAFGIHPLAVILGLGIGLKCFGALGIIVALPLIGIVSAIVDYEIKLRKKRS